MRQSAIHTLIYAYDVNGTLLDSSRIYVLNSNGKLMAEYIKRGGSWRLEHYNIYGNDLLGKLDSLGKRYYYLTDHLGSVRVTVKDTVGSPVDSWSDYYPFGKEARGSSTPNEPKESYTGQIYDAESDLTYYKHRYYNQNIARFISVDPLTKSFPHLTPYQYASNRPVSGIDLDGLEYVDFNTGLPDVPGMIAAKLNSVYNNVSSWYNNGGNTTFK